MSTTNIGFGEAILMSTLNIGFYEEICKIISLISSNTHLISSDYRNFTSALSKLPLCNFLLSEKFIHLISRWQKC